MLFFFVLPFALIVNVSLSTAGPSPCRPTCRPSPARAADRAPAFRPDPASYARLGGRLAALGYARRGPAYLAAYANSLLLATLTTLCCLVPRLSRRLPPRACAGRCGLNADAGDAAVLDLLPLLRVYAWMGLLDSSRDRA